MPIDWTPPQDCTVQTFTEKRHFLREDEYRAGVNALAPLVEAMREAIDAERERNAQLAAEGESVEPTDLDDQAVNADDVEDEGGE